eukprot:10156513-Ditylum_brightwellii.AAC.1
MDQGLHKFVEFCTCLESCEPSKGGPKGEKPAKTKTAGNCKAEVLAKPTTTPAGIKYYCKMHMSNRTHSTTDCIELN